MLRRGIIIIFFAIAVLLAASGLRIILSNRPRIIPKEEAIAQTRQLVDRAGGSPRICEEAATIFRRFDTGKFKTFHGDDLNDFPAINSMKAIGIWPTGIIVPPGTSFIRVRVGNHFKSFEIHIFDPELDPSTAAELHEVQVDHCIYVLD